MQQAAQQMNQALSQMQAVQQQAAQMQQAQGMAQGGQQGQQGQSGQQGQGQAPGGQAQGGQNGNQQGGGQQMNSPGMGQWGMQNPTEPGAGAGGGGRGMGGTGLPYTPAPFGIKQEQSQSFDDEEGRTIASTLIEGETIRGESTAVIRDIVESETTDVTDEVASQRVSRRAQKAVRDYFNTLRRDAERAAAGGD
jgi:hypothetical protein